MGLGTSVTGDATESAMGGTAVNELVCWPGARGSRDAAGVAKRRMAISDQRRPAPLSLRYTVVEVKEGKPA